MGKYEVEPYGDWWAVFDTTVPGHRAASFSSRRAAKKAARQLNRTARRNARNRRIEAKREAKTVV